MATLLTNFIVPAASTQHISMYVGGFGSPTNKTLKLLIDVFTSGTIGTVTSQDGYGGPSDPAIVYPWNQPIPLALGLNTFGCASPLWSLATTNHSPTALTGGRQQVEIVLDLTQKGDWINIAIPAHASNSATVNVYGTTT